MSRLCESVSRCKCESARRLTHSFRFHLLFNAAILYFALYVCFLTIFFILLATHLEIGEKGQPGSNEARRGEVPSRDIFKLSKLYNDFFSKK